MNHTMGEISQGEGLYTKSSGARGQPYKRDGQNGYIGRSKFRDKDGLKVVLRTIMKRIFQHGRRRGTN